MSETRGEGGIGPPKLINESAAQATGRSAIANFDPETRAQRLPKQPVLTGIAERLGRVIGTFDPRERALLPEEVTEQVVADAVYRLANGNNMFDVRSVAAELGYLGSPGSSPQHIRVEEEVRRRLLGLKEKGALKAEVIESPNIHDQRLQFGVTSANVPVLRQIAYPKPK